MTIDAIAGIDSPQRRVRKVPIGAIEAIALVDKVNIIFAGIDALGKYGLASVGIASVQE
jgi:hypothetical protein